MMMMMMAGDDEERRERVGWVHARGQVEGPSWKEFRRVGSEQVSAKLVWPISQGEKKSLLARDGPPFDSNSAATPTLLLLLLAGLTTVPPPPPSRPCPLSSMHVLYAE